MKFWGGKLAEYRKQSLMRSGDMRFGRGENEEPANGPVVTYHLTPEEIEEKYGKPKEKKKTYRKDFTREQVMDAIKRTDMFYQAAAVLGLRNGGFICVCKQHKIDYEKAKEEFILIENPTEPEVAKEVTPAENTTLQTGETKVVMEIAREKLPKELLIRFILENRKIKAISDEYEIPIWAIHELRRQYTIKDLKPLSEGESEPGSIKVPEATTTGDDGAQSGDISEVVNDDESATTDNDGLKTVESMPILTHAAPVFIAPEVLPEKPAIQRAREFFTKESLTKLVGKGMTNDQIAEKCGFTRGIIRNIRGELKVTSRGMTGKAKRKTDVQPNPIKKKLTLVQARQLIAELKLDVACIEIILDIPDLTIAVKNVLVDYSNTWDAQIGDIEKAMENATIEL